MTKLSVNVNKVALMRNARGGDWPSVPAAAKLCLDAGAHGITVHPRPDQRHITVDDVFSAAEVVANAGAPIEYNMEGNPFSDPVGSYPGFIELVEKARPTQVTLVPDSVDQLTSNHGWNLRKDGERVREVVARLKALGCRVSLFMDAEPEACAAAADTGADRIELYTEDYASAHAKGEGAAQIRRYAAAAEAAQAAGLGVNAGHDLNLANLSDFCSIPGILEVSIGQALVGDALMHFGLGEAVRRYLACLPVAV